MEVPSYTRTLLRTRTSLCKRLAIRPLTNDRVQQQRDYHALQSMTSFMIWPNRLLSVSHSTSSSPSDDRSPCLFNANPTTTGFLPSLGPVENQTMAAIWETYISAMG
jgi:hypothetical protein